MKHFITGVTGFLGSSIVLDLLRNSDDILYCMVRPKGKTSAYDRFFNRLKELIAAYAYDDALLQKAQKQCIIVEGALGVDPESILSQINDSIDQFIHSAASLNYEERFREEIFETNVGGTQWALLLSGKLNCRMFNYVSTSYVVGCSRGEIKEEYVDEDKSNNVYESSKLAAEKEVVSSGQVYRIFRPGIIIGHSKTQYTFNFTGLYGFIRKLIQFKGVMGRIQKGYLDNNKISMMSEADVTINLVQVDMVSEHIVRAIQNNSTHKFYHLTHPKPFSMKVLSKHVFEMCGLDKPILVTDKKNLNWIDQKFNEKIDFYKPQFFGKKDFDRSHINAAINENQFEKYEFDEEGLKEYINWYVNHLNSKRRAVPATR